jgi:hypothetical protein
VGTHWAILFLVPGENGIPPLLGETMLQTMTDQTNIQSTIISTLTRLREEWQEATDGASLFETNGNMGLVLADLINGFGLDTNDQCRILGNDLFHELKDFLYAPKQN